MDQEQICKFSNDSSLKPYKNGNNYEQNPNYLVIENNQLKKINKQYYEKIGELNNKIKNLKDENENFKTKCGNLKLKNDEINKKLNENMDSEQLLFDIFKEELKNYFLKEEFLNNLINFISNSHQNNKNINSNEQKSKILNFIYSICPNYSKNSTSQSSNNTDHHINSQVTSYQNTSNQTNPISRRPISKLIYIHFFSQNILFFTPISNFFEINPPKEIIDSKIKFKIQNGCENYGKNEFSMAAFVVFFSGGRIEYSTFSEKIEDLERKYKKVILIVLLGGSNSTPIIIEQFKGDQINLNYFNREIIYNQLNKESIKSFCKKLNGH